MAKAKEMMGAGLPSLAALAINGSVATAISAAGTSQSDATTLTNAVNMIGTAAASSGVIIPVSAKGDEIWVYNGGANAVNVYPPSGAKFNSLSTNGAVAVATNTNAVFKCVSSTQWLVNLSA